MDLFDLRSCTADNRSTITGRLIAFVNRLLEAEPEGTLQTTPTSDTVHAALAAAQGARDLTEIRGCKDCSAARIGLTELRRIRQLHRVDTNFTCKFVIHREFLGKREVVLPVTGTPELVSSGVAEAGVVAR